MPKEYRERIIDEKPFRVVTLRPKRDTTTGDETPTAEGLYDPGVALQDGDGVLWFLRLDYNDDAPSSYMTQIADATGAAVTFSRASASISGAVSPHWIEGFFGNTAYDSEGDPTTNDYIYPIWEQFTGFTPGTLYFKFNVPGSARANVEAAFMVRGVDPEDQGAYQYYVEMSPQPVITYDEGGSQTYNAFPYDVPLTADNSVIFLHWDMVLHIGNPGGYVSAPGTSVVEYTTDDASDPPALTNVIITYIDDATGATETVSAPSVNNPGTTPAGMAYTMSAIVLNSLSATSMTVYPLAAV